MKGDDQTVEKARLKTESKDATEPLIRFADVTASSGIDFVHTDGDGDLDHYVANYVDFTYENYVPIKMKGTLFQAGPQVLPAHS